MQLWMKWNRSPVKLVLRKTSPSVFGGTPLLPYLISLGIDTIITCGESTSGCIRSTVVDGRAFSYLMIVVEECVFIRTEASHAINLFDMNEKYADVLLLSEVLQYLKSLPRKRKLQAWLDNLKPLRRKKIDNVRRHNSQRNSCNTWWYVRGRFRHWGRKNKVFFQVCTCRCWQNDQRPRQIRFPRTSRSPSSYNKRLRRDMFSRNRIICIWRNNILFQFCIKQRSFETTFGIFHRYHIKTVSYQYGLTCYRIQLTPD